MKTKGSTIARAIVLAIALINIVLVALGKAPFELDENVIYDTCSCLGIIVTTIIGYWKDNPYTKKAKKANQYLRSLKEDGEVNANVVCENSPENA